MNKVVLMGRLTRDPDVRYSQGENPMAIARYTLAVDRRFKRNGEQEADFINCVAFGRAGEFAEKYLKQGTKMVVSGRIQTGSYTNRDGIKVYTTDVVIEEQDFAESKAAAAQNNVGVPQPSAPQPSAAASDGFMNIPDGLDVGIAVNVVGKTYESTKDYGWQNVLVNMLNITLMLTVNLGILNLLPVPALDGGRLVFLIWEAVTHKPVPPEKEGMVHFIGLMFFMVLMVFLLFNDLVNIFG